MLTMTESEHKAHGAVRPIDPTIVIEYLRSFNSKERFFLIGHALDNPTLKIGQKFKTVVEGCFGIDIPDNALTAMDYHLDWLWASLYLACKGHAASGVVSNAGQEIRAQQEDIDLLIAFPEGSSCHIVLVEAKGVTGWTNKQMASKVKRFEQILGADGRRWPCVVPHFLLLSPRKPQRLNVSAWPSWMTAGGEVPWCQLPVPNILRKVTRCNSDGKESRKGSYWMVSLR
jgi:hypothetical protein